MAVSVAAPRGPLAELIGSTLGLYDVRWEPATARPVRLEAVISEGPTTDPARGSYLECAQMLVDPAPGGLRARTSSGGLLVGRLGDSGDRWRMEVPSEVVLEARWPEVEDMLSLVLTTGWRRTGWVPLHAAGLTDGRRGVIVCATSGGGKTTFTLAMARRGWRSLGDDKLLLGQEDGSIVAAALTQMLNVDPQAAAWFPELSGIAGLEQYSAWTVKRRASMASLWPSAPAHSMLPTSLVVLERGPGAGGMTTTLMGHSAVLAGLLRQTVIPRDRDLARAIMATLSRCAAQVSGLTLSVGKDAYSDPRVLDRLDEVLR